MRKILLLNDYLTLKSKAKYLKTLILSLYVN